MNRSILIVICDFLLVSLLAFSTADINKVADEGSERPPSLEIATNQVDSRQDLGAVMRLALDEERKNRDVLLGELAKTREAASKQQTLLSEREKQVQTFQQELEAKQQQTLRLQQEQTNLQQQFAAAQTNIQSLNQEVHNKSLETVISKEALAAIEAEAQKQSEQAAALQKQLAELEKTHQIAVAEKQQLASQLQVAEAEKRFAAEQASHMREEVQVERQEKSKLADGVKALATESGALAHELRDNRPLAPNTIFNEFATNQVQAHFHAFRSGLLGLDWNKQKETETVLASDGTNFFALCHVQDTPLTLGSPGTDWEELTGTLGRHGTMFPIRSLSFYVLDPRLVLIPVTAAQARDLGCKVYRIAADPFKFQDAVVVGAKEGYYGESKFEIDLTTPQYIKMDRNSLKGLFGKFNPSRGDLVFNKTGELLGVMANGTYCILIHNLSSSTAIQFGPDVRAQHTGDTLSVLYSLVAELPLKLQ